MTHEWRKDAVGAYPVSLHVGLGQHIEVLLTCYGGFGGDRLVTCASCGEIFAVDTEIELYVDFDATARSRHCPTCDMHLCGLLLDYPEHVVVDGRVQSFDFSSLRRSAWWFDSQVPVRRSIYSIH